MKLTGEYGANRWGERMKGGRQRGRGVGSEREKERDRDREKGREK